MILYPRTTHRFLFLGFLCALACATDSWADEVVLLPLRHGGSATIRSGTIIDYTGSELKLETVAGRVETIPVERIQEVRANWSAPHQTADGLLAEGRVEAAAASYRDARKLERRRWVVRRITAQLVSCYLALGAIDTAGDEFLALAADDPQVLHLDVIPLPWRAISVSKELDARARAWLVDTRTSFGPLLGASWLLGTSSREAAIAQLTQMANGKEKTVALLAETQIWRTQLLSTKQADVERWETIFERLPDAARPTACYILGDAWSRQNRPDLAATYYLQLPILYSQQRAASADALLAAGKQLEQAGQSQAAMNLYRELLQRYPASPAAASAKSRLPADSSTNPSPTTKSP